MYSGEQPQVNYRTVLVALAGLVTVLALQTTAYVSSGKLDAPVLSVFAILTCTWTSGLEAGLIVAIWAGLCKFGFLVWLHSIGKLTSYALFDPLLITGLNCSLAWVTDFVRERL